jgi:hypothetical protein
LHNVCYIKLHKLRDCGLYIYMKMMNDNIPLPSFFDKKGVAKRGTWKKLTNHQIWFEWMRKSLNFNDPEDLYKLNRNIITNMKGHGLFKNYYHSSPYEFVKALCLDNYEFLPWKFGQTSHTYWDDLENHKVFANWLGKELRYTSMEDWYQVSKQDFKKNGGDGLLQRDYKGSIIRFVRKIFKYEWLEWKFSQTTKDYFDEFQNRILFTKWLGRKLGYTRMEDWYQISSELIHNNGGGGMIQTYYRNSCYEFVSDMFRDHEFYAWLFKCSYRGLWEDTENHKRYVRWLGKRLKYTTIEDWYKITVSIIESNYGGGLLQSYYNGSPSRLIISVYRDYPWVVSKFKKQYSQGQIEWLELIKVTIPDIRHMLNHPDGEYTLPDSKYKVDGITEIEKSIFEYHGDEFHGNPNRYHGNPNKNRKPAPSYPWVQLNPDDIFPLCKKTYGELYANTLVKRKFCEEAGYKYYFIWESDWLRGKKALTKIQRMYRNKHIR